MSQQEEFKKKMWDVVTPHIYGGQAPKAPSKAISIYDIEKEKQKVRDLENANAQGEAYGLARLSAPVYQPQISEVPIIENADEILAQQPKQEVKEEAKIEQPKSFYSQFLDMTKAPITAEEQARRDRASRAVQATGALGNLMSAFANLTFTGKGAPSQALPTQAVDKIGGEMTTWQDKLRSEREKYAAAGLAAIAKDYEIAYRAAKDKEARELADRNYAEQVRQFNEGLKYKKQTAEQERQDRLAQQAVENEHKKIGLGIQQKNADTSRKNAESAEKRADAYVKRQDWLSAGGGSSQNWQRPISIVDENGNEKVGYINTRALNESNLQQIVETLPDDIRKEFGLTGESWSDSQVLGAFDDKVARAIGEAAKDMNSDTYKYMERLGLIAVGNSVPSSQNRVGVNTRDGVKTGGLGWGNGNIDLSSSW